MSSQSALQCAQCNKAFSHKIAKLSHERACRVQQIQPVPMVEAVAVAEPIIVSQAVVMPVFEQICVQVDESVSEQSVEAIQRVFAEVSIESVEYITEEVSIDSTQQIFGETELDAVQSVESEVIESAEPVRNVIEIFTDGAAPKNGQNGCVAAWGVHFPNKEYRDTAERLDENVKQTNNRAELMAIHQALVLTKDSGKQRRIYTDSQFSIDCLTKFKKIWIRNGFTKVDGTPVSNEDLLRAIYDLWDDEVELIKVAAHQTDDSYVTRHNNIVDKLANKAALDKKSKAQKQTIQPAVVENTEQIAKEVIDDMLSKIEAQSVELNDSLTYSLSEASSNILSVDISKTILQSVKCHKCNMGVRDIMKAQVICQGCYMHDEKHNVEVADVFDAPVDFNNLGTVVCDLRPVVEFGLLRLYAPTNEQPKRLLNVKELFYQALDNKVLTVTVEQYKATVQHILDLWYIIQENEEFEEVGQSEKIKPLVADASKLSLFYKESLTKEQIIELYQQNPKISENIKFLQKIQIDYDVQYQVENLFKVYIDIETTCGDGVYKSIPQPEYRQHYITMIQVAIEHSKMNKPIVALLHRQGYAYNTQTLVDKYPDMDIRIHEYADERLMVDTFWGTIMNLKGMVALTGFNATHTKQFGGSNVRGSLDYNKFYGYDLNWLCNRTSFRFTPKSKNCKISQDFNAMCSQIAELPNVLMMDYQGLAIQKMTQKAKNKLDSNTLDSVLKAMFEKQINEVSAVAKIENDSYDLQKHSHEQLNPDTPRVDMTEFFDYAINDVVCLLRCEKQMGYIDDTIFTTMEANNTGMSIGFTLTGAQMNTICWGRELKQRNQNYKIVPIFPDEPGIDGAYTQNHEEYTGQTVTNVVQDDYNSLYPSVIRDRNISPDTVLTITSNIEPYSDNTKYSVVEVSDDKKYRLKAERTYVVFTREFEGIMPVLVRNSMSERTRFKNLMKTKNLDPVLYKRYDQMQNSFKVKGNSFYGASGSKTNPYYSHITACAITAYARNCLAQLNRAVHTLYGFNDPNQTKLVDDTVMTRVEVPKSKKSKEDEPTAYKWIRTYYDTHVDNFKSRVVQNDTDAGFNVVGDLQWFKQALADPSSSRQQFELYHKSLEQLVAKYLQDSTILKFAAEEFIVALVSSQAKKSYIRVDIISNEKHKFEDVYAHILNDIIIKEEGKPDRFNKEAIERYIEAGQMEVTIKGVAWATFHVNMRKRIRELFFTICITNEITQNIARCEYEIMADYLKTIKEYINGDTAKISDLQEFAKRVKTCGKGTLVQYINSTYNIQSDTVYLLPMIEQYKGQKKASRYIPLQAVTKQNRHLIDDQAIMDNFKSQMKKFFNIEKASKTTILRSDLINQIQEDQVMIRFESVHDKQFDQKLIQPGELKDLAQKNEQYTLHEVIHNPMNKLFFDIDNHDLDLTEFKKRVFKILSSYDVDLTDLQMFVCSRPQTSKRVSYHITFNIVMPLALCKIIAGRLIEQYKLYPEDQVVWLDTAPYSVGKTLRTPYTYKLLDNGKRDMNSVLSAPDRIEDHLITYTDGYRRLEMPQCLMNKPIIAFDKNPLPQKLNEADIPLQYKQVMESVIIYEDSQTYNQFIKYASVKNGHLCPACKKPHNNEKDRKLTIMQTHNEYKINCLRKQKDGNVSSITIPISPDIVKRMKEEFKQQPLNTQIKFATEKIPNQDSRYVEFDLDSDLLYVKSNMGSGKTEQLVKHLPPYLKTNNAVMLSVRQTLSTEWMKRYTDAGIQMFDYREITGTIQPQKGAITIIQVDSLCRLSLEDVNILILDEVQSIIAQLNSSQLRDKTGVHNRFVELVKQADKVLCMDANLHESTMDMIDYIRNQTGRLVWNTRQTYQHVDTVIRKFQSKGMDHLLNYYKQKVIIEGKNIIGHVNSFKKATKIVNYLKELKPDLKIKFYHGEDRMPDMLNGVASLHKDVKLHDLNDVKNIWKQQQVVIYTGTISAGIDFSLDHFHENISVFNSRANSADQFMQGLMRCRKLIDNRITLYLQDMNKSAVVTNAQVFKSYTDNMRKFGVSSNNILNPLFNLQVYLQAYEMQQNARPIDIIIATLNLMGMRVSYDALSKEDTTKQELYTKLTSVETKVTKNTLQTVSSISEHSCKFFINRHIQTKVNEMLVEQYNPQIYIDIPLIAFLAAVYKSDIIDQETFKDPVKLHQVMNDRLQRVKQLSQAEQDELLNEYDEYEQYREYKMFQPKDTHITQMSDTQADLHIQNILEIHGKQFNDRQKLKNNKLQNFELPKIASQVKQALEFYRAFVKDPKSEETANIAKSCGVFTRPNYRRIFLKIGVSLKRIKTKESKVVIDGKRKTIRQYNMILKPFFSNTVLYEASDN